jgi:hypothetical protein
MKPPPRMKNPGASSKQAYLPVSSLDRKFIVHSPALAGSLVHAPIRKSVYNFSWGGKFPEQARTEGSSPVLAGSWVWTIASNQQPCGRVAAYAASRLNLTHKILHKPQREGKVPGKMLAESTSAIFDTLRRGILRPAVQVFLCFSRPFPLPLAGPAHINFLPSISLVNYINHEEK